MIPRSVTGMSGLVNLLSQSGSPPTPTPTVPEMPVVTRPADWMAVPDIDDSEEKVHMLVEVYAGEPQLFSFRIEKDGVSDSIEIDWGDGTTQSITSGALVVAEKTYDVADLSHILDNGNKQALITITTTGVRKLERIEFNTGTSPMGLVELKVSGSAMTSIGLGSGNIATISPKNLQFLSLNLPSLQNASYLCSYLLKLRAVKKLNIPAATNVTYLFFKCSNAVEFPLSITVSPTSLNSMFEDSGVVVVPEIIVTSNPNAVSNPSMCYNCLSLEYVMPSAIKILDAGSSFRNTPLLRYFPEYDYSLCTDMVSAYRDSGIRGVLNISLSCTSLTSAFYGCQLTELHIDCPLATNISSVAANCYYLKVFSLNNASAADGASSSFSNCYLLEDLTVNITGDNVSAASLYARCYALKVHPPFQITGSGTLSGAFQYNYSLEELDISSAQPNATSDLGSINTANYNIKVIRCDLSLIPSGFLSLASMASLEELDVTLLNISTSVQFCNLGRQALVNLFNQLADLTSLSTQTLTITGNPGADLLSVAERDIALNKNWTLVG